MDGPLGTLESDYGELFADGQAASGRDSYDSCCASDASSSERERWFRRLALPWWQEMFSRATRDQITIACYPGHAEYGPDGHRDPGVWPSAALLHPWTRMTLRESDDFRTPAGEAIHLWHRLARTPYTRPSSRSDAEIDDDYAVLCEQGSVVALRFTASAVADVRPPREDLVPRSSKVGSAVWTRKADRMGEALALMHRQNDSWRNDHIRPWAAEIVRRALREGRRVFCSTIYERGLGSLAARAYLFDPSSGLEVGAAERLLSGTDLNLHLQEWIDAARP